MEFSLRKGNVSLSAHPLVCGYTGYGEFLLCLLLNMEDPAETEAVCTFAIIPYWFCPQTRRLGKTPVTFSVLSVGVLHGTFLTTCAQFGDACCQTLQVAVSGYPGVSEQM